MAIALHSLGFEIEASRLFMARAYLARRDPARHPFCSFEIPFLDSPP